MGLHRGLVKVCVCVVLEVHNIPFKDKDLTFKEAVQKQRYSVIIVVTEDKDGNIEVTSLRLEGMALRSKTIEGILRSVGINPVPAKIVPTTNK